MKYGLILLIILFGFYWFQWRPAKIRMTCTRNAYNISAKKYVQDKAKLQYADDLYKLCLNLHGLK